MSSFIFSLSCFVFFFEVYFAVRSVSPGVRRDKFRHSGVPKNIKKKFAQSYNFVSK